MNIKKSWFTKQPKQNGPLTYKELDKAARRRLSSISHEVKKTFEFMKGYPRSVTFLGSARFDENHVYSIKARRLAQKIVRELNYAVVTGGGPGIMEAANRGAFEAGGKSIGMKIHLKNEQESNKYQSASLKFYFFFVRKVALVFSAEAYIFFPGGLGTFDEFFEIITLIQTGKIPHVPIILVGTEFWTPLDTYLKTELADKHKTISNEDRNLYKITDSEDEIIDIVRRAPLRRE